MITSENLEYPDKLVAMVTKNDFFMLNRLTLKVTKFQLSLSKRLGTVVKNILGGGGGHHALPHVK